MRWLVSLLWFGCVACQVVPADKQVEPATEPPVKITVIGTSDFHGALESKKGKRVGGRKVGGIDIIAAYFESIRAANKDGFILLDAGDLYQGTLISAASEGRAVIEFYNEIGYDAVAVGNHEFDFGPVGYHSTPANPDDDPLGVIKLRIAEANFPFLAANINDRTTKKPVSWKNLYGHTILTRKGIKIGVIGLISQDTSLITNPKNVASLQFEPLVKTIKQELVKVRQAGATVVIVLAHAGVRTDQKTGKLSGPIAELAQALKPGEVDLIVAGHEHVACNGKVNKIPIIQTWAKGVSFSRAELPISKKTGRVISDQVVLHSSEFFVRTDKKGGPAKYAGRTINPSTHFVKKLKKFKQSVDHLDRIELGRAAKTMQHQTVLDSPVGNLVTDAMRATDSSIDISMYNSGGLRTSIQKGVVTYGRIYEVVPFDNNIITVSLTGAQIREIVEHGLSGPYGVMEISGLSVVFNSKAPTGKRCMKITTLDGQELDEKKLYTVATNDFVLSGGDGYHVFAQGSNIRNTHTLIREVVARYIKEKGTIAPGKTGRYKPVNDSGASKKK
ncbi:MAG: 5'-nucleotidase C-terminal domain-containing protein [Deltaproteobacteria bacterium]|nr:5'-nucleotidase C-terminal domain-containing protein [Deltaproteobacteria bacterium]